MAQLAVCSGPLAAAWGELVAILEHAEEDRTFWKASALFVRREGLI